MYVLYKKRNLSIQDFYKYISCYPFNREQPLCNTTYVAKF